MLTATFFRAVFGNGQGFVCIAIKRTGGKALQETYYKYPDQLKDMHEYVERTKYSGNVYFCPQILSEPRRVKANVSRATCAWSDLDTCHPRVLLVRPTIALETSPNRYQAFWAFEEPRDPTEGESVSRRIAYHHADEGADRSGWDLTQLLRVPGTRNFKYGDGASAPEVKVLEARDVKYRLSDFSRYPQAEGYEHLEVPFPDELIVQEGRAVLDAHRFQLSGHAYTLFEAPVEEGKRSDALFRLEMLCAEADMTPEETFQVARDAACNKWQDEPDLLWKDVCRAFANHKQNEKVGRLPHRAEPDLISEQEVKDIEQSPCFVERYIAWAKSLGDAAPQYHQASAFVILSALLAGSIVLPTSFGDLVPNIWVMVLADTTLSRKAQPLTAKVLTPTGWRPMGDLAVDDLVIGRNGQPTKVLSISPGTIEDVYSVTFNDGATTECTSDHLWEINEPGGSHRKIKPLSWIMQRPLKQGKSRWIRQIPMASAAQLNKSVLPVGPYLMGLLIGDGSYIGGDVVKFTSADVEILDAVRTELAKEGLRLERISSQSYDYRITGITTASTYRDRANYILRTLRSLEQEGKRAWEKSVPETYLNASAEDRLAVLQGLMDTDGWATEHRGVCFSSSSKQLTLDVQYLARSLGGWSNYDGGHPTKYKGPDGTYVECREAHQVSISMPLDIIPFRLTRKASRLDGKRSWARPRSMRSIEYVGKKEVQCIKVAASDGLYVTDDFIVTHNTTAMNLAVDLLDEIDSSLMMATDGSIEGLTTGLSTRPGRVSIFFRDEFTGLMEQMTKKDYMAGMPEFFTQLYDSRTVVRRLRKEEIRVQRPRLIIFAGGIKSRMQQLVTYEHVSSGFMPRFIFVTAVTDPAKVKPLGRPTEKNWGARDVIKEEMNDIYNSYRQQVPITTGGKVIGVEDRVFKADLSDDAWARFNKLDQTLMALGMASGDFKEIVTPLYARLGFSILKSAVLIAASRQKPDSAVQVEEADIVRAIYYGTTWKRDAEEIVSNVGKSTQEHKIEMVKRAVSSAQEGRMPRSKLMQRYHLVAQEMSIIERTLEDRGLITVTQHGRQRIYQYNPNAEV